MIPPLPSFLCLWPQQGVVVGGVRGAGRGCQEVLGITLLGRNKGSLPLVTGPEEAWIVFCIVPVKRWGEEVGSLRLHTHTHTHPAHCVLSRSSTGSSCKTGSRLLTTRSQLLLFVWKISGLNGSISTVTLVSFPLLPSTFLWAHSAAASRASRSAWWCECAIKPSLRLRRAGFFLSFWSAVEWKVRLRLQINRRLEPSRAKLRDQIDGRLLCGVGISGGFEVSPAAQLKGEELTFGPGGKLLSPVNVHKPNFPLAHQQSFCVCPAVCFTGHRVDPGWKIWRRVRG